MIEHPEYGEVIQLQGDQRKNICQFLLEVRNYRYIACSILNLSGSNSVMDDTDVNYAVKDFYCSSFILAAKK